MIAPKDAWHAFLNKEEKLAYMKKTGFIARTVDTPKQLVYNGFYGSGLCSIVGYRDPNCVIISFQDELHCIDTDCLKEMQSGYANASLPEEYVVLDIETTGLSAKHDDIIELAAIKIRLGRQIDTFESLIATDQVLPLDIQQLTGIHPEDLESAPESSTVIHEFANFIAELPLVAHNAPFDIKFLKRYFKKEGLPLNNKVFDTLNLARKAFPVMGSHTLCSLKGALNIQVDVSHRALPDVIATNELYRKCAEALIKVDQDIPLSDLEKSATTKISKSNDNEKKKHKDGVKISDITPNVECFDCAHPLYQRNIVFTGELSLDRKAAMQMAVNVGAKVKSAVSGKTDYLVVGKQDITVVGEDGMSNKEEKAQSLNQTGKAHIKVITEAEFLRLLEEKSEG